MSRTLVVWVHDRVIAVECARYRNELARAVSLGDMIRLELEQ